MIMCTGMATLGFAGNARAQSFEGCGVLGLTQGPEECLEFFADNGEYPRGLGRLAGNGWENFQEGDHIYAAGQLESCGGICTDEGLCFEADSLIEICPPPIPTLSEWGMVVLVLLILAGGAIAIRNGKRIRYFACIFSAFFLLALCTFSFAQSPLIAQKVNRMLRSPHDPERLLVRFKPGVVAQQRANVHAQIDATHIKNYRYVDGLTLIKIPAANLENAGVSLPKKKNGQPDVMITIFPTFALSSGDVADKKESLPEIKPGESYMLE